MRAATLWRPIESQISAPFCSAIAHADSFDPNADVPDKIETESERVAFLAVIAQVAASRAGVVLRTNELYAGDGHAVPELLKLTRRLQEAELVAQQSAHQSNAVAPSIQYSARPGELSALRSAAGEINERGARLYELLKQERVTREARASSLRFVEALSSSLDARAEHELIERSIRDAISVLKVSGAHVYGIVCHYTLRVKVFI